jgi:hypothetical protein
VIDPADLSIGVYRFVVGIIPVAQLIEDPDPLLVTI